MRVARISPELKPNTCSEAIGKSSYRTLRGCRNSAYQKVDRRTWETLTALERVSANNPRRKVYRNGRQGVGLTNSSEEASNERGAKGSTSIRNG